MPRGDNPNSRKALNENRAKTQFNGETAVKAAEKSAETRAINKSLNEDLRERCTPEVIEKINNRVITMAMYGNLKAYELIRDGLGEKPRDEVMISGLEKEQSKLSELLNQRRQRRGDTGC